MTALAALAEPESTPKARPRRLAAVPRGAHLPRIAPPRPRKSRIDELIAVAKRCGITFYPWQVEAGTYMTATKGKRWRYPELCVAVARQNGKTELLVPRIVMGLENGERIMHTAQDRSLPRDVFVKVADIMESEFAGSLKSKPRLANGTERIQTVNGGLYRIVAPSRGGARGPSNDLVIVDEAREMDDFDFIAAAQPTLTVSESPQFIYLSNAGTEDSVVLNSLRERAGDPELGYIEWSAHEDRAIDDRAGWLEANPSLAGGSHAKAHMAFLERMYRSYDEAGKLEIFETEHLCRRVITEAPRVVPELAWERAGEQPVSTIYRPVMGIAQDPQGRRASAVIAWVTDGMVNVHVLADYDGYPVDLKAFADLVTTEMRKLGCRSVAYDAWTDRDLARYFKDPKPMQAAEWEGGCLRFAREVESGSLRYSDPDGVLTGDMAHTVRHDTPHAWIAKPASHERATTASLAAIRAVWLATNPSPQPPRVY